MDIHYTRVWANIDLDGIKSNMEAIHGLIKPDTKVIAIIKTDGYGHGALPMAQELESLEYVWGYGVATAEEALMLRNGGMRKPILIIGYSFMDSWQEMIVRDIRLTVFDKASVDALDDVAGRLGNICKVHIKLDTGMSRIGITPDEKGFEFVQYVATKKNLEIEGIFTHFARADETDKSDALAQKSRFDGLIDTLSNSGIKIPMIHAANSAAIIDMEDCDYTNVRAGIILYGMWPSDEVNHNKLKLTPLLSLKSRITYVKTVPEGTAISYGGTYVTKRESRIATVPVGYGDGYPRSLSNKGYVLINGRRAPITGRVCMDQFMCDVTDIPDVHEGLEVTLVGRDRDDCITFEDVSEWSGMLNYELACIMGKRVPRIYTRNGIAEYTRDYFLDANTQQLGKKYLDI